LLPFRFGSGLNLTALPAPIGVSSVFICGQLNCSGLGPAGFTPETVWFKNPKIAPGGYYLEMLPFNQPNSEMKVGSETNNESGL
jgi:hypothetical protein